MRNAHEWARMGRPTRADVLAPRGLRERLAAWLGGSLLTRWDHELGAETLRANGMTEGRTIEVDWVALFHHLVDVDLDRSADAS